MALLPDEVTTFASAFGAVAASAAGWFARHTIRRVDELEKNSLTRSEFEAFCESREHADTERSEAITRLESKIDGYHVALTARIDRLLERRNGSR
jgi:hypothetical protein